MTNRKQTIFFKNRPRVLGRYSLVGPKEGNGNFGKYFHEVLNDDSFGEKSYEKAEFKMLHHTITQAIRDAKLTADDIDVLFSGDLMNQIISSSFAARSLGIPYIGVFGACSTMAESLIMGACFVDGGFGRTAACATGSHFSTAERQFRTPLELGNQRQTYSQWTVTGMGSCILSCKGKGPCVRMVPFGKVTDYGIKDIANMGAAMAPAAMDTLYTFFQDTKTEPKDYDLILSGDLGKLGSDILKDLMREKGYILEENYEDCGHMIYSASQKTFQVFVCL